MDMYYHIREQKVIGGPEPLAGKFIDVWKKNDFLYCEKYIFQWSLQTRTWVLIEGPVAEQIKLAMLLIL